MAYEKYLLLMNLVALVSGVAWKKRATIRKFAKPSYQDLVAERRDLHDSVEDWKYPDGSYVPQHKRQKMFRDLRKLSRKIREHPDNPGNKS